MIGNDTESSDLLSVVQKEAHVIEERELYRQMARVSVQYVKLKEIFDQFSHLAESRLRDEKCPVKGVSFSPELEKNSFDFSINHSTSS